MRQCKLASSRIKIKENTWNLQFKNCAQFAQCTYPKVPSCLYIVGLYKVASWVGRVYSRGMFMFPNLLWCRFFVVMSIFHGNSRIFRCSATVRPKNWCRFFVEILVLFGVRAHIERSHIECSHMVLTHSAHIKCSHMECSHIGCSHIGCSHIGCSHIECSHKEFSHILLTHAAHK